MDYYKNKKLTWKDIVTKIPFVLLSGVFMVVAAAAVKNVNSFYELPSIYSLVDRVFMISYSTMFYLFKVFSPVNLCALHYYPLKTADMLPTEYYLALPALLLLLFAVIKSGRFRHELIFGMLFLSGDYRHGV